MMCRQRYDIDDWKSEQTNLLLSNLEKLCSCVLHTFFLFFSSKEDLQKGMSIVEGKESASIRRNQFKIVCAFFEVLLSFYG